MQSGTHGFFTMLLTAVPLLAVPALAIFGIPQFAPMSASPHAEDEEKDLLSDSDASDASDELLDELDPWSADESRTRRRHGKPRTSRGAGSRSEASGIDDIFDGVDAYAQSNREGRHEEDENLSIESTRKRRPETSKQPTVDRQSTDAISELDLESQYISDDVADVESAIDNQGSENLSGPLAWKTAVRELKRLGISEYRLEPGSDPETFLFCCMLPSADKPRVVRRFEAEADDPLAAVAEVIRQVREHARAPLGN